MFLIEGVGFVLVCWGLAWLLTLTVSADYQTQRKKNRHWW